MPTLAALHSRVAPVIAVRVSTSPSRRPLGRHVPAVDRVKIATPPSPKSWFASVIAASDPATASRPPKPACTGMSASPSLVTVVKPVESRLKR